MPKIDTTKIENYANMTAEEKLAALESYEYAADNADTERLKAAVSRANSEAAELKRQLKAKQTEEERKEVIESAQGSYLAEHVDMTEDEPESLDDETLIQVHYTAMVDASR